MNAAIQLIPSPLGALPMPEAGVATSGDVLEFVRKDSSLPQAEQATQLEAENIALRRELVTMQQAITQKDVLLKNARIREMELRSHLAGLMC
jgi:hypothetical protein